MGLGCSMPESQCMKEPQYQIFVSISLTIYRACIEEHQAVVWDVTCLNPKVWRDRSIEGLLQLVSRSTERVLNNSKPWSGMSSLGAIFQHRREVRLCILRSRQPAYVEGWLEVGEGGKWKAFGNLTDIDHELSLCEYVRKEVRWV